MTLDITLDFTTGFFTGSGNTGEVPDVWDVALNGRGYMLDTGNDAFKQGQQTIPLIRQQANNSDEPNESTINPEDLWPRSITTWHKGSGQKDFDSKDSDRSRYRESFGVDPWERNRLSLLNDTEQVLASANTNLRVVRAGEYTYISNGTTLVHTLDFDEYSDTGIQAGQAPQPVASIASDGGTIYAALGSNGITRTTRGSLSSSVLNTLEASVIGYVKGRLMAAQGNAIYNVTGSGVTDPLFTHPNTDFSWIGFAEGQAVIYAAGYSGDKSLIYRTAVKADGTVLEVPIVAGELPDGEIVRAIQGYLGFIVIGTDRGFRIGTQDQTGNITLGALVETSAPVRAFEPQGNFVWFGWENPDATHSGLGRMDLTVTTPEGAPAYATDIMAGASGAPVQGLVTSIITTVDNKRVFSVAGKGIYVETDTTVASGWISSGKISFGIPSLKIALLVEMKHEPLPNGGSVSVEVSPDDADFVQVGTSRAEGTTSPPEPMRVPEVAAQLFELRFTLENGAVLERADFRAYPSSTRGVTIKVPILLHEYVVTAGGLEKHQDVALERRTLEDLIGTRHLVTYQELETTKSVTVEDCWFQRSHPTSDRSTYNGTAVVTLKILGVS